VFFFAHGQSAADVKKKIDAKGNLIYISYSAPVADRAGFAGFTTFFHQCGMPSLPIIRDYVIVPKNCKFRFTVKTKRESFKNNVFIPQSKPQTIDSDNFTDSICDGAYDGWTGFLPAVNGSMTKVLEFSSFDLLFFEVYPYRYNPAQRTLSTAEELVVEIAYSNSNQNQGQIPITPMELAFCTRALNYDAMAKSFRTSIDSFPNYVIVTQTAFAQAADTLALWKAQQGYRTRVFAKDVWAPDSIRMLMLLLYANDASRPSYLCLLGDTAFVPATEKIAPPPIPEAFSTDLYFSTMDSDTDMTPNFGYGRISVNSAGQAISVVDKLVRFQKHPPVNPNFYGKMVNCSFFQDDDLNGYDDRRFVQTSEEIRNYLQTHYSKNVLRIYEAPANSNPQFWNNDDYADGSPLPADLLRPGFAWNGSTSDIVNALNQGTFLMLHRDHGYSNASGWAHPQLASAQLQYLTNDSLLPLVFSINCYSGNFRVDESFGEKLLLQPAGASGVFAPSNYSYSGNNDAFALGLFDALFPSPGLIPQFNGTGGNHSVAIPAHSRFNKPGDMLQYAQWYMNYTWGADRYSSEIAHFLGDPAMPVFTDVPQQISALFPDSIDCVDSAFIVVVPNASGLVATLSVDNQVVGRSYFSNDTAHICFLPRYGDQALLTVTGDGYAPFIRNMGWYCSQPIYPPVARFSISDTLVCNGAVLFLDSSMNFPTSWHWNFGDGTESTLQNPSHQYALGGNYAVTLKVENNRGADSLTISNIVDVIVPAPVSAIDTAICQASSVLFANLTPDSLAWFKSISANAFAWENFYSLNVSSDTSIFRATYQDMPTLIAGKTDTMGNGGYIYQNTEHYLSFTATEDILLSSVDIYALASGASVIKLADSDNQIVASKTVSLQAGKNSVNLDFFIPQGPRYRLITPAYCSWYANFQDSGFPYSIPGVVSIDSSSIAGNYYGFYNWRFRQRCYGTRQPVAIRLISADTTLSLSGEQMLCPQSPLLATADSTADCLWNTGDTSASLTIQQPGWYFVQLTKQNCTYHTDTLHVMPFAPLTCDFSFNEETSPCCFQNLSQNAFGYLWDFGDGSTSMEPSPCHQFQTMGNHTVTLTAINNCDSATVVKTVVITQVEAASGNECPVKVIPNPANRYVQLSLMENNLPRSVKLFDANGRLLIQMDDFNGGEAKINIQDLAEGIYYLKVVFAHSAQMLKLVKISNREN
jgi:PKD repeat protein